MKRIGFLISLFLLIPFCGSDERLESLLSRGQEAFDQQNYTKSKEIYETAVNKYPKSLKARSGLAYALMGEENLNIFSIFNGLQEANQGEHANSTMGLINYFLDLEPTEKHDLISQIQSNPTMPLSDFYQLTNRMKVFQEVWNVTMPVLSVNSSFCSESDHQALFQCPALFPNLPVEQEPEVRFALGMAILAILVPHLYALVLDINLDAKIDLAEDIQTSINEIKILQNNNPNTPAEAVTTIQSLNTSMEGLNSKLALITTPTYSAFAPSIELLASLFPQESLPETFQESLNQVISSLEESEETLREYTTNKEEKKENTNDQSSQVADNKEIDNSLSKFETEACDSDPTSQECANFKSEKTDFCQNYETYLVSLGKDPNETASQCQKN